MDLKPEDVCEDCKREVCWGGSVCIKIKEENKKEDEK